MAKSGNNALALRETIDGLPPKSKRVAAAAYSDITAIDVDTPDLEHCWRKICAVEKLATAIAHTKEGDQICKILNAALKNELATIREWYEHERVERFEDLVRQLGGAIWSVLEQFVAEEQRADAKYALDAVVKRLSKP